MSKTFAETYTMRSRFYQLLGEAGKLLADAYCEADAENRATIKELVSDAMRHSLVEHHRYRPDDIPATATDLLDLLAFIESGMSMTGAQRAARWPEWHAKEAAALARYAKESGPHSRYGSGTASTDPMVDSHSAARHHWVHLPLIRARLEQASGK